MSKTYISVVFLFDYHVTSFMVGIWNSAETIMMVPNLNELSYCYKTNVAVFLCYWQPKHHSHVCLL